MSLSPSVETWASAPARLGRRVLVFPRLESTNSFALSRGGDPDNDGLVVLAREQSAGRGQHGRSWQAPPGSSVLMSVLLFPPAQVCRPSLLTAWATVSVVEVIREMTGTQAKIKWPNDVYLEGKKVCGILIEQRGGGRAGAAPATAVGIGLNVLQNADFFEQAELPIGGSLFTQTGQTLDPDEMARRLVGRLDEEYGRLEGGDLGALESRWQGGLGLIGQRVIVEGVHGMQEGELIDLTLTGLALERDDGVIERLAPEMVRRVTAY